MLQSGFSAALCNYHAALEKQLKYPERGFIEICEYSNININIIQMVSKELGTMSVCLEVDNALVFRLKK